MAAIIRLSEWPFDEDERVTLWWLRSPWRESIHRQWRLTAIFRRNSGELREVEFPWGILPWLKIGQVFQNGQPLWGETKGRVGTLIIPSPSATELSQAEKIPVLPDLLLGNKKDLKEYCFKVLTRSDTVVAIPLLECIRALLVFNKLLAFGILEPQYFERVIAESKYSTFDKLSIEFSSDMSKKVLSRPLVFKIARLLKDASFRASWNQVYENRFRQSISCDWNSSIPLLMSKLPNLKPEWQVRGVFVGKLFLVQQILIVEPQRALPFKELEFTHPRIQKREYVNKAKKKRQSKPKDEKEYLLDDSSQPPNVSKPSQSLPKLGMAVLEKQKLKISQVGSLPVSVNKQLINPLEKRFKQDAEVQSSEVRQVSQLINLSDKGVNAGNVPTAEFTLKQPLEIFVLTDDGLDEFAEAVQYLDQLHNDVSIIWNIYELIKEIPFAKIAEQYRKYALLKLEIMSYSPCWILEFGRPDNFSISTLIFTFSELPNTYSTEHIVDAILSSALYPQGGWNSKPLKRFNETFEGFKFGWVKHTNSSTEDWGERLYKNSKEVLTKKVEKKRR